jgi:hypothetical protein
MGRTSGGSAHFTEVDAETGFGHGDRDGFALHPGNSDFFLLCRVHYC